MRAGTTPEELETLLEDAVLLQDGAAMAELFEPDALLVLDAQSFTGREQIAGVVRQLARDACGYVGQPRQLYQARDVAMLLGAGVTSVAKRGRDGEWRFVITRLVTATENSGCSEYRDAGTHDPRKEDAMYTMVVKMSADPARREEVKRHFAEDVVGWAKRQPGFVSGQWLCTPSGDEAMGVVVFESADAADTAAKDPRAYGLHGRDATRAWNIEDVTVYEQVERA